MIGWALVQGAQRGEGVLPEGAAALRCAGLVLCVWRCAAAFLFVLLTLWHTPTSHVRSQSPEPPPSAARLRINWTTRLRSSTVSGAHCGGALGSVLTRAACFAAGPSHDRFLPPPTGHPTPAPYNMYITDERVSTELKKQIIQARTAKKLTQSQLGQVRCGWVARG